MQPPISGNLMGSASFASFASVLSTRRYLKWSTDQASLPTKLFCRMAQKTVGIGCRLREASYLPSHLTYAPEKSRDFNAPILVHHS
jgi:hypothetical protein